MLLSLLVLFIGCSDESFYKIEETNPEIVVYPELLQFGHIESGIESGIENFIVMNAGDQSLSIDSPVLVLGDGEKFEVTGPGSVELLPEEFAEYSVTYRPKTYESNRGQILITSSDDDESEVFIDLEGYGDAPVIEVTPEIIDYGILTFGCDNEERVTISNKGNLDLIVDNITQLVNNPADLLLEFGSLPEPPWLIEPDKELDFLVSYIPEDIGLDESLIQISSNDPINPVVETHQYGETDYVQLVTDTWEQEEIPIIDLLWVIDNSGSMQIFQNSLSANSSAFMSTFLSSNADYHIAVITTDDPKFSVIVNNSMSDPAGVLSNLFLVGNSGSGMEKGIEMSYRSLSDPLFAGVGGNFFREDASLVVVYVSDENDQSGFWMNYVPFFEGLKPEGMFIPYGVIGDSPAGCEYVYTPTGYTRTVPRSAGYHELISHFGGDWFSICSSDWGSQMQELSENVVNRSEFKLSSSNPIEETIQVYVNGQLVSEGWSYSSENNSVIFDSRSVPDAGQTIEIVYAVWGCGDE